MNFLCHHFEYFTTLITKYFLFFCQEKSQINVTLQALLKYYLSLCNTQRLE